MQHNHQQEHIRYGLYFQTPQWRSAAALCLKFSGNCDCQKKPSSSKFRIKQGCGDLVDKKNGWTFSNLRDDKLYLFSVGGIRPPSSSLSDRLPPHSRVAWVASIHRHDIAATQAMSLNMC